ncbi:hypothetical protein ACFLQR_00440 [Verrucomicrobiota bacterium]
MKQTVLLFSAVLACATIIHGATEKTPGLEEYKAAYQRGLQNIADEYLGELTALPDKYLKALEALERKMQKAGDIDGWVVVKKERERFVSARDLPDEALLEEPAELKKLQIGYRRVLESAKVSKAEKIVALAKRYRVSLERLTKELTKAGQMEEALRVKAEKAQVESSTEVTVAMTDAGDTLAAAGNMGKTAVSIGLKKGLIVYYSFDKNEKGKVIDKSGKENHGKVHGAKWIAKGQVGGAFEFDGKDDYIDLGRPVLETKNPNLR